MPSAISAVTGPFDTSATSTATDAGEERPDDRDERAEEHQRGQRDDQRDARGSARPMPMPIASISGHADGRAHVGDQRAPRAAGGLVDVGAASRAGNRPTSHSQIDRPSLRKKNSVNRVRKKPVNTSPTVAAVVSAPEASVPWLSTRRLLELVDGVVELALGDREGADDEGLDLADALADLRWRGR